MSLINDALQRAKQSHQNAAPAGDSRLRFRPAEPGQPRRKGIGLVLPATVATILVIGGLSLWLSSRRTPRARVQETPHAGQSAPATASTPASSSRPKPRPSVTANSAAQSLAGADASVRAPAAPGAATAARLNLTGGTSAAPVEALPPKPAPPRLQAILFSPARPSAIISGKTVFVGDRVGDFHVADISPDSATLVSETQTNVLRLE